MLAILLIATLLLYVRSETPDVIKTLRYEITNINSAHPEVIPVLVPSPNAHCSILYTPSNTNANAYDIIVIETNKSLSNTEQAYCAGYIEGYVASQSISDYYINFLNGYGGVIPEKYTSFASINYHKSLSIVEQNVNKGGENGFWQAAQATLKIINGLSDGYNSNPAKNGVKSLSQEDLAFLNMGGDMDDLEGILDPETHYKKIEQGLFHHCTGAVSLIDDSSDIILAHSTWSNFLGSLNRVMREYRFHFNFSSGKYNPPSTEQFISFSSYPAVVFSLDDFYISRIKYNKNNQSLSSSLATAETTYHTFNTSLYLPVEDIRDHTLLCWVRALTCNLIATNGNEWYNNFNNIYADFTDKETGEKITNKNMSSYTYNNNWYSVDYAILNKIRASAPGNKITKQILEEYYNKTLNNPDEWLVFSTEVVPQNVKASNWLGELLQNGYLPSINTPEDKELYKISGYEEEHSKEPAGETYWSYEDSGRYKYFAKYMPNVKDEKSFREFIRMNRYKDDPDFSHLDPAQAIASRYDLRNPEEMAAAGYYVRNPSLFGQTDAKYTRLDMSLDGAFKVISGQTTDDNKLPLIDWSKFLEENEYPKGVNIKNNPIWTTFDPDFIF